jgi:hypothetical protein
MPSDFWAGYFSGAAGICVGNPLDVIKVQLQAGYGLSIVPPCVSQFRTAADMLKGILRFTVWCPGLMQFPLSRCSRAYHGIWGSKLTSLHDLQSIFEET